MVVDDADELIGREEPARSALDVLNRAAMGQPRLLVIEGAVDGDLSEFLRWFVSRRPAVMRMRWFVGSHVGPDQITALEELLAPGEPSATLIVFDEGEELGTDAVRQFVSFVHALEDAADRGPCSCLVVVSVRGDPVRWVDAMRNSPLVQVVHLPALEHADLFELACRVAGAKVSPNLVDLLGVLSGGQPGAVRRLLHRAMTDGLLEPGADGLELGDRSARFAAHVEGRRRGRPTVPPHLRQLMEAAACLGRRGDLALLASLLAAPGGGAEPLALGRLLDEASEAALLDDDGQKFWILDLEAAASVYADLPVRARQRLHAAAVTAAVELGGSSLHDDAMLHHVQAAGRRLERATARQVLTAIAGRAEASGRWSTASEAIDLIVALDPQDAASPETLIRAAEAHYLNSAPATALERLERARLLAEASGSPLARAALLRAVGIAVETGMQVTTPPPDVSGDPVAAAWMASMEADRHFAEGAVDAGLAACDRAEALADVAGEPEVAVRAALASGLQHLLALSLESAATAYGKSARHAERCDKPMVSAWAPSRLALVAWMRGDDAEALERARGAAETTDRNGWWSEAALAHAVVSLAGASVGRFDLALRSFRRTVTLTRRSSYAFALPLALPIGVAIGSLRGDPDLVRAGIDASASTRVPTLVTQLVEAIGGSSPDLQLRAYRATDLFRAGACTTATELADWSGCGRLAAMQREPLEHLLDQGVVNAGGWPVSVPRSAAVAAYWDGDASAAEDLLRAELARATASGAVFAAALAAYDLARWGLGGSGIEHLAQVVRTFDRLGLPPWVARAQAAVDAHPEARRLAGGHPRRVLLYTDLVGSTALNVRAGDERFIELLTEHQEVVDRCVSQHRGTRFHNTGDGFGIWFATDADALACAEAILHDLEGVNRDHPTLPLQVRIGIAAGHPIPFDGDLYGLAVVRAARVCALAGEGQVLLAPEVAASGAVGADDVALVERRVLKGFDLPTDIYELRRRRRTDAPEHALPPRDR